MAFEQHDLNGVDLIRMYELEYVSPGIVTEEVSNQVKPAQDKADPLVEERINAREMLLDHNPYQKSLQIRHYEAFNRRNHYQADKNV